MQDDLVVSDTGRIRPGPRELFTDLSWFFIFEGLGVEAAALDPLIDDAALARAWPTMLAIRADIAREVRAAPSHDSHFPSGSAVSPIPTASRYTG